VQIDSISSRYDAEAVNDQSKSAPPIFRKHAAALDAARRAACRNASCRSATALGSLSHATMRGERGDAVIFTTNQVPRFYQRSQPSHRGVAILVQRVWESIAVKSECLACGLQKNAGMTTSALV
jgi:hypothetical protein